MRAILVRRAETMLLRRINLILFAISCFIIAVAYYLQLVHGDLPCCLCVIQRLAFIALATSFLCCALQRPKYKGLWIYTILNLFITAVGLTASGRQIWLQNRPLGQDNMCVPTLPSAMNNPSILNVLNTLGTHQCAEAGPYFLGLSLSIWTFLFFTVLGIVILIMPLLIDKVYGSSNL